MPESPSLVALWFNSLRLRPLLWLAPCAAAGGALGFQVAGAMDGSSRETLLPWLLPLLVMIGALAFLAVRWRGTRPLAARACFGAVLFVAMGAHAAWRVLPPQGDVSLLIASAANRQAPLAAPALTLRGWVADHPVKNEFSTEFPLACAERGDESTRQAARGRVWVSVPPEVPIQVGQAMQVEGELRPLVRATNPGQRESHWRLVLRDCWSTLRVRKAEQVRPLRAASAYLAKQQIARWRRAILTRYETAFEERGTAYPRATAQLITAMTFGEGGLLEPLPFQVREEFRVAGLSHVLVASGAQIALLAGLLLAVGQAVGLRRGWLLALVLPVVVTYAALAGGEPSILRATAVGLCVTLAVLAGRDVDALSLWSLAFIVLVLIDPLQMMSLSFQLSFAAAWGMIAIAPRVRHVLRRSTDSNMLTDLMAFSLGAQLGVLPILLYHFGRVSIAGIGANFLGVPLAGVLVGSGIAGLIFPLAWLNGLLTQSIAGVATFFATLPGAQIEQPPVRLLWTLFCFSVLAVGIFLLTARPRRATQQSDAPVFQESILPAVREELRRGWRRYRERLPRAQNVLIVAVFVGTVWMGFTFWVGAEQALRVTVLDVGQGESIVIQSTHGRTVLIDGGSDAQGLRTNVGPAVIVPYLRAAGVRKIDVMVITHADADHCNGLLSVVREVPVGLVLDGAPPVEDAMAVEYLELKQEISRRNIRTVPAQAGQSIQLGDAALQVLAPLPPALPGDNNNSTVLKLIHGQTSMLFTGDIEREAEERLVRRGVDLECTILKAGHHGSQTSTTSAFLKAAQPQVAIISCGRYNRFRHPAPQVLSRLQQEQVAVFRTDLDGAIEIRSDGKQSWIQTAR